MTDYSELIARVRSPYALTERDAQEISDALEAQDARIAELESENAKFRAAMEPVSLWSFEAQDGTPAIKELHDDIMRIRAALKGEKDV
jgi:hypothetical protein